METIVIGANVFSVQRTYVDKDLPADNFASADIMSIAHSVAPSDPEMFGWIRFDLTPLKGKKRIVSAIIRLRNEGAIPQHSFLQLTEPVGPCPIEDMLTYDNMPATIDIGIPLVPILDANPYHLLDISSIITDLVEGRRENKGLVIKVVPPDPDADVSIQFGQYRYPAEDYPLLTVILDPTVQPPRQRG